MPNTCDTPSIERFGKSLGIAPVASANGAAQLQQKYITFGIQGGERLMSQKILRFSVMPVTAKLTTKQTDAIKKKSRQIASHSLQA